MLRVKALADEAALHVDHRDDHGVDGAGLHRPLEVFEPEIAGHAQNPCSGGANREPSISTADIRRDSATFSSRVNHSKLGRRKPQLLDLPGRLVMILAAFALGVWLAWTVGAFYRFRHRPAHRKASLIVNAAFLLGTTA